MSVSVYSLNRQERHQLRLYYNKMVKSLDKPLTETQMQRLLNFIQQISKQCSVGKSLEQFQHNVLINTIRTRRTPFSPSHVTLPPEIISDIAHFLPFATLAHTIPQVEKAFNLQKTDLLQEHLWHKKKLNLSEAGDFSRALKITSWRHFFHLCYQLEQFSFDDTDLPVWKERSSDTILIALGRYARQLKGVEFYYCPKITSVGLTKFSRVCPQLTYFAYPSLSTIDNATYTLLLQNCHKITQLEIFARNDSLYTIGHSCPNISRLTLDDESNFSIEGFQSLINCHSLEYLGISGIRCLSEAEMLEGLSMLTQLTQLDLSHTCATDDVILGLQNACPKLRVINVSFTLVTYDGVMNYLKKPNQELIYNEMQFSL